jgi:hypothetical protein
MECGFVVEKRRSTYRARVSVNSLLQVIKREKGRKDAPNGGFLLSQPVFRSPKIRTSIPIHGHIESSTLLREATRSPIPKTSSHIPQTHPSIVSVHRVLDAVVHEREGGVGSSDEGVF